MFRNNHEISDPKSSKTYSFSSFVPFKLQWNLQYNIIFGQKIDLQGEFKIQLNFKSSLPRNLVTI